MGIANAAQALASQQEEVAPELADLSIQSSILRKRIHKANDAHPVSGRPYRVPTLPSRGGKPRVGDMNGGDLGIGSGPTQVVGQLTTTCFITAFSYTKDAEYQTDSSEKAIEDFATLTRSIAPKQMADFLDISLQGDGSNTLDTITGLIAAGGDTVGLTVGNANFFLDDMDFDIWTAVGGAKVGANTCQDSDVLGNTIWLANPVPTGTYSIGQKLLISGSSGQPNSGMLGLRYYQVGTNTGNWMGIPRSSWPGKYNTPTIPVNGALTPQIVRSVQSLIELSMGPEKANEDEIIAHCNVSEQDAWEQNALLVQHIDMARLGGDRSVDMLKKKAPDQIGGREMLVNPRSLPGTIDFLAMKNSFEIETKPLGFYDVGGQTLFPVIGGSGGLTSSLVFYMVYEGQLGWKQTRLNAFLTGIQIPSGLFGQS